MKRGSTLFLKLAIVFISIIILSWLIIFPSTEGRAKDLSLIEIYMDPFIIYIYIAFIPFLFSLYNAFKLLGFIEKNKIFSQAAVKTVRNIKYSVFAFIGFIALALVLVFMNSKTTNEDGAGALMMGIILLFASSVIATGAAIFEKLLQNGVEIKSENDLTV